MAQQCGNRGPAVPRDLCVSKLLSLYLALCEAPSQLPPVGLGLSRCSRGSCPVPRSSLEGKRTAPLSRSVSLYLLPPGKAPRGACSAALSPTLWAVHQVVAGQPACEPCGEQPLGGVGLWGDLGQICQ